MFPELLLTLQSKQGIYESLSRKRLYESANQESDR